ncbi:hypothetical protein WH95_14750 [Kiloniella litopenaei]|uniref:DUF2474 domain-containing protein n=1 Tax=Kiloniella litopenaei TaxID=1549748 RepID=A0A0M2R8X7_9PROT|nr:DUF2474 family protein [Kiloniella litopenaei]KKJ76028.1 hypothetical protein WH95_14750 [Kiloniella litopenaei]
MATNSPVNKTLPRAPIKNQAEITPQPEGKNLWHRLIWFVGLWLGGVFALGVVGYAIRAWLGLS